MKQSVRVGTVAEALAAAHITAPPPRWFPDDLPRKYVAKTMPPRELGLTLNYSEPSTWHFIAPLNTNTWGEPRGYAIVPGATTVQLLPPSHPATKAGAWTKYALAVSVHHDTEQRSSAPQYDLWSPGEPVVSLDNYLDAESLAGADLVGWVTVGLQHVPRVSTRAHAAAERASLPPRRLPACPRLQAEDVPLISNMAASFYIKPWNYFDHLAALEAGADDAQDWPACTVPASGGEGYTWSL